MTASDDSATRIEEETPYPAPRTWRTMFGGIAQLVARIWIVGLLLVGAGFAGVSANQMAQAQAQLRQLRAAPGPDAYAVAAYRRELERQVRAYQRDWRSEAVPTPPTRPRLLEEIDLARARNSDAPAQGPRTGVGAGAGPISAPD